MLPPGVLEIVQVLWSRVLFEAHRVRDDATSGADRIEHQNEVLNGLREQTAQLQAREKELNEQSRAPLDAQRCRPKVLEAPMAVKSRKSAPRRVQTPGTRLVPRSTRVVRKDRRASTPKRQ